MSVAINGYYSQEGKERLYVTRCNTFLHSVLLCAYTDYYDHCDYYDDGNFFRKSVSFPIQGSLCHMYFVCMYVCMFDVVWLLSCLVLSPILFYYTKDTDSCTMTGGRRTAHGHAHAHAHATRIHAREHIRIHTYSTRTRTRSHEIFST